MKLKPFDGVKMDKTKSPDYKVGNKKLSKKLKNIKMFEEFNMNENLDPANELVSDFVEGNCEGPYPKSKIMDRAIKELKDLVATSGVSIDDIVLTTGSCGINHIYLDPVEDSDGKAIGKVLINADKETEKRIRDIK
jgi:hypothetical protein